jgi:hypothetical protein
MELGLLEFYQNYFLAWKYNKDAEACLDIFVNYQGFVEILYRFTQWKVF